MRQQPAEAMRADRNGRRRGSGERGNATVEFVALVFPVAVVLLGLLFATWQLSIARHDVTTAAAAAARAASLHTSPQAASSAAHDAAEVALGDAGRSCTELGVAVDTSNFGHGGHVTVTVSCQVTAGDLILLDVPADVDTSATARAPIETYRQLDLDN
jgi:Flp pilus assembly protein TadG